MNRFSLGWQAHGVSAAAWEGMENLLCNRCHVAPAMVFVKKEPLCSRCAVQNHTRQRPPENDDSPRD